MGYEESHGLEMCFTGVLSENNVHVISRSREGQTGKNPKNIYFYLLTTPMTS